MVIYSFEDMAMSMTLPRRLEDNMSDFKPWGLLAEILSTTLRWFRGSYCFPDTANVISVG